MDLQPPMKAIYIKDIIKDKNLLINLKLTSPEDEARKREEHYYAQISELIEQYPITSGHPVRRG
jgi:hypothetical protein